MSIDLPHACAQMVYGVGEASLALIYEPAVREYSITYDDEASGLKIQFCPFCGQQLPGSLRDIWVERVRQLGLSILDTDLPADLRTNEWWRREGLS